MIDDALKAIRSVMTAGTALALLWALSLPTTVEELRARESAESIVAWLTLKGQLTESDGSPIDLREFRERFVMSDKEAGVIDQEMKEPPPERADLRPGADNSLVPESLLVRTMWPYELADVAIRLVPRANKLGPYTVYRVESNARFLPFDNYDVVIENSTPCHSCVRVIGDKPWERGPRDVQFSFNREYVPIHWTDIRTRLFAHGFVGTDPAALKLTDAPVNSYTRDVLAKQHSVWGVSLDSGLFFAAPGLLLGIQAIMLLAPLLVLTSAGDARRDGWLLSAGTSSPPRPALEMLAIVISVAWILLPPAILITQLAQAIPLHTFERVVFDLGAIGIAFATAVNAVCMFQLWRVRRSAKA